METTEKQINDIVNLLQNDPDSPIAQFINGAPPHNDMSYLQLWFDYIKYMYDQPDQFQALLNDGWLAYDKVPVNFETRYQVWKNVRKAMDRIIEQRLTEISFKPRLEQYIETYPENERETIRKIILIYLFSMQEKYSNDSLIELGEKINIRKEFLYSLHDKHRLFRDKVIEVENTSFSREKQFLHRDIVRNAAIFKIFAGFEVTEQDMVMLKGSSLLSLFDLIDESYLDQLEDMDSESENPDDDNFEFDEGADDIEKLIRDMEETSEAGIESMEVDDKIHEEQEGDLLPYQDDLEYLYNEYLWLKKLAELKELKNKEYSFDRDDQLKVSTLEQECRKQKRICEIRLRKSSERKYRPRLEALGDRLKLNEQERNLIKLLVTNKLFMTERRFTGDPTVGEIMTMLYDSEIDRVKAKKMLLKNAKLVRSNIIQLGSTGIDKILFDCNVIIDNRLVEYLIGEDYDISNYIEGSTLYKPAIPLDNVILPKENKTALLNIVDHFPSFLKAKKEFDLSSVVEYGDSLVLLFVGPSGTGKTMLANALANYLDKRILLFNLNNLSTFSSYSHGNDNLLSLLFREARMNEAVLFFDEAEGMLSNRMHDLLIEIEKHQGIVIFATNASFKIDEAMRRRINHIQNFEEPGPALRKHIWEIHLPQKVNIDKDVDLDWLARRYEINGGLIKNAVFAALAKAVSESDSKKPVIKINHLMDGAREQLNNKLFMSNLQQHKVPQKGIDSVILPRETLETLYDIANIEKARKVLVGEWGFNEVFPDHNGVAVLFHGPPGTGKTYTAEALAYETGKNLKIVNYAQVISMWVGGTEKALEALFNEVADSDSILLFDEADAIFASRTGIASANDRFLNIETDVLLGLIERFNSIAILTTNYIENIDQAFFRRMQYIVEFKAPDENLRVKLWNTLCPPKLPISKDVDFGKLAADYQFTGGDIKNAIIRAATKRAVRIEQNRKISMQDIETACREIDQHKRNGSRKIGF